VLDLGCGPRDQAAPVQHYNARYVGVDYDSPAADLLADAHAIPFRASTFDVVISYAVFEHLYHPHLAATEVARVLRSGGVFAGVVSQGEPFHTAFGVLERLTRSGLKPRRVWPSYDTLHGLAVMGRYPTRRILLFRWPAREKQLDEIHRAASIGFVAEKIV
jgi:SAM-dependent methyltransferase